MKEYPMTLRKVLLARELGGGFQHLQRLLTVSEALSVAGWQPVLAVQRLSTASGDARTGQFPLFRAPVPRLRADATADYKSGSYAEILNSYNYFDHPTSSPTLRLRWCLHVMDWFQQSPLAMVSFSRRAS
jgi:hypothetical protein